MAVSGTLLLVYLSGILYVRYIRYAPDQLNDPRRAAHLGQCSLPCTSPVTVPAIHCSGSTNRQDSGGPPEKGRRSKCQGEALLRISLFAETGSMCVTTSRGARARAGLFPIPYRPMGRECVQEAA